MSLSIRHPWSRETSWWCMKGSNTIPQHFFAECLNKPNPRTDGRTPLLGVVNAPHLVAQILQDLGSSTVKFISGLMSTSNGSPLGGEQNESYRQNRVDSWGELCKKKKQKQNTQPLQIRAGAEIWAEIDMGWEHRQGSWIHGRVAKAEKCLVKKQG